MAGISSMLGLTMIVTVLASAIAVDYCTLKSCTDRRVVHTMCKYPSSQPAPACGQWKVVGLNKQEKDSVVRKHNELRRRVASGQEGRGKNGAQPPALYMPDLSWDNELEMIAQRWTNQCSPGHDACRNVERYCVGQNMAMSWSSGENRSKMEDMVQSWYDEVGKFDKNQVSKITSIDGVGHYTQIVWAATTKIGCGRILYKDSKGWNTLYFICNYGPCGNVMGTRIYEIKK